MPELKSQIRPGCPVQGTVLAFDYGLSRTGAAVGSTLVQSARPLEIFSSDSNEKKWRAVLRLVSEWEPVALVVGVPRHPDGAAHEMTARSLRFARQCAGRTRLPVYVVDERYSSVVVEDGRQRIDDASAAVILQQWFDEGCPANNAEQVL
ncbi:MAG TPA: Holliday junction resolvase RuvX [Sutterella sp.]|nr:Holliday junction resolvase RuvX [Sutterella sp.]